MTDVTKGKDLSSEQIHAKTVELLERGKLPVSSDVAAMDLPSKIAEQFDLFTQVNDLAAIVEANRHLQKNALELLKAELFIGFKNSEEKMTETLIKSRIEVDPNVQEQKSNLALIEGMAAELAGAREAFIQRHYALRSLISILTAADTGAGA